MMEEFCIKHVDRLSCPSAHLAGIISRRLQLDPREKPIDVIHNPMDFDSLGDLSHLPPEDTNYKFLLFVGRIEPRKGVKEFIDAAVEGAQRAAALTQRLLAFARQQPLSPEPLQVDTFIASMTELLTRTLGEHIVVETSLGQGIWHVNVDRAQLESTIINLAVNARDAMPDGGRLTVRTRNVPEREASRLKAQGVIPAEYVLVEVQDTGTGMTAEVMAKIFEPFFSTKDVGKGTGLGLSTVYGIVKQTGGHVLVESTVGRGSMFTVLIPRYYPQSEAETERLAPSSDTPTRDLTGAGSVLVVEDEDPVRAFSVRALRNKGYTVSEARSGVEALEVLGRMERPVDLIVTDVMMPLMDGPSLIKKVREKWPTIKVICISGYAEESFRDKIGSWDDIWFLPKPYSLNQLAGLVKDAIGAGKRAA